MKDKQDDAERFARIRDQQLQARDPQKKARQLHHGIAQRHKRAQRKFSLAVMLEELPNKWFGLFVGALLGVAVYLFLPLLVQWTYIDVVAIAFIPFLMLVGLATGAAIDSRQELEELIDSRRKRG